MENKVIDCPEVPIVENVVEIVSVKAEFVEQLRDEITIEAYDSRKEKKQIINELRDNIRKGIVPSWVQIGIKDFDCSLKKLLEEGVR